MQRIDEDQTTAATGEDAAAAAVGSAEAMGGAEQSRAADDARGRGGQMSTQGVDHSRRDDDE